MGRVAAPFGVKGWVKIQAFSDAPGNLLDRDAWRVGRGEVWKSFTVEAAQEHGNGLIAKFEGIDDRDSAFALRGQEIAIERASLPGTDEDEYYWSDLIGLRVVNKQGVELGRVSSLMETGAHDVLVVTGGREYLIPFVGAFVGEVDLAAGRLEVDWGEDY